ncbi:hypothetical protein LguiB_025989 [Lonicera macranthoides]
MHQGGRIVGLATGVTYPTNKSHLHLLTEWKPTELSPCNWMGISCSGGRVTGIDLYNSTIFGKLFGNFSAISELTHLNLSQNMISGEILANLGRCQKLEYLNLTHNKIDEESLMLHS